MTEVIVKIMVELLSVLAVASKQIKQERFSKCAVAYLYTVHDSIYLREIYKKLPGESEIEVILQRLGRLIQEEARIIAAQTLGVVHSLVGNVKTVLAGARSCKFVHRYHPENLLTGKVSSDSIRQDLSTSLA